LGGSGIASKWVRVMVEDGDGERIVVRDRDS